MKTLKYFLNKLNDLKYYIILFILAFFIFFIIYFPKYELIRSVLSSISAKTGTTLSPVDPQMTFFPSIGLEFKSAKIITPDSKKSIDLGATSLGVTIPSLMIFSPAIEIQSKSFRGEINAKILGLPLNISKPLTDLYLDIDAKGVSLSEFLRTKYVSMDAIINLTVQGNLNLISPAYSDLDIVCGLKKIQIKEANIMGFVLPAVAMKSGDIAVALSNGELTIAKFNLGAPGDELNILIKGKISLKTNNPYDLILKIKATGSLEQQFGQILAILPPESKNADGFYNVRLRGDSRSPIPQITPMQ